MQHSSHKNALGPTLKEIRLLRGWTLKDVSGRLDLVGMTCSIRQLTRIEAQQRAIKDFEILYFCSALEVTQKDLGERLNQVMVQRFSMKKR